MYVLSEREVLSTINRHLLVLNGYKAYLILKVLIKTKTRGIDMIFLSAHTSHGLQFLDVSCFKPFKVDFRIYRNSWCIKKMEQG